MPFDIPAGVGAAGGILGMLAGLYWMLATDRMVTGAAHRRELASREKENERLWQTVESLTESLQKLTVNSELTVQTFRAIDKKASGRREQP